MIKLRDIIELDNGDKGIVYRIHEYGYVIKKLDSDKLIPIITSDMSNIPKPKPEHGFIASMSAGEVCKWLDNNPNRIVVGIAATLGGYTIFYQEDISKFSLLGDVIQSIFD